MKRIFLIMTMACCSWMAQAADAPVATEKTAASVAPAAEDAEAKYTKAIEGRTADILKVLALTNAATATSVHDIVMAQWRDLRSWHDVNDTALKQASKTDTNKAAEIRGTLKTLHDQFIGKLSAELTPAQVEAVKDKMTYGKVQFTYNGYLNEYPDMNDEAKARVLDFLKQAREEAMDAGSADEKSNIFNRYKGRVNNYLSKQGYKSASAAKKEKSAAEKKPANPEKPEATEKAATKN